MLLCLQFKVDFFGNSEDMFFYTPVCQVYFKNVFFARDEKSDLHPHWHPVPKYKCRDCNTLL